MASKFRRGRGNVHYTSKKNLKYIHYISYIVRKYIKFNLHNNGGRALVWPDIAVLYMYKGETDY